MFTAGVPVGFRLLLVPLLLCCVRGALPFPHGAPSRMDAALPPLYRLALPRDLVEEEALPARDAVPELRSDDLLRLRAWLLQLPGLYPNAAGASPSSSSSFSYELIGSPSKRQMNLGSRLMCQLDTRNCPEVMKRHFQSQ
ncbi:uncharacterized protein LOC122243114 isoform X2 [Penaeus japonicus]|uniref:uncharacterized protein LOC122243114 isoform X2 n=1 Tax=Penaeus japonicus TaxID=27405 RepID=UPI001C711860|nr:uncharacterized protein LOC122243114 isoform X2 [Penaeus japonicus]